jgi:glycosyltransferase involved in cell wall biosynthesis
LLVNSRYRPPYFRGGVERYVHVLAGALRREGYDCEPVALEEPVAHETDIPHSFIDAARIPFIRPLLFGLKGRKLWKEADLIVLQYTPLGVLMPKDKLVCTVHTTGYGEAQALETTSTAGFGQWWKKARRTISYPLERRVFSRARWIVAISEQIAAELVDAYGIARSKIVVVGNGVDCGEFSPDPSPKGRKPFRLLYVGRLASRKNVDALIRAAAECRMHFELRIVGTGPEGERLQQLVADLQLGDRVEFRGFRKGPDLLTEYRWADLLIMPSSYEGVPLVALEAKAAGLPILAANFPGADRIVSQRSGRIVATPTPTSLARAIEEIASDSGDLNEMAATARKEALEKFSWETVIASLRTEFEAVMQSRASAAG